MQKINLTGEYFADATLDTQSIPLQPLLATYAPAEAANLGGATEVHAILQGPLKDWKQLEIHVTVPELNVNYGNSVQLAAASPIHIDYTHGLIALQESQSAAPTQICKSREPFRPSAIVRSSCCFLGR